MKLDIQNFESRLYESRAVSSFAAMELSPPFIHALVYGHVDVDNFKLNMDEVVNAVTVGRLKPERSAVQSLVRYCKYTGKYVIGNHLQSSRYRSKLLDRGTFHEKSFECAADVLLEIIPGIRLHKLIVPCHRGTTKPFIVRTNNEIPLPHEACWNRCFTELFKRDSGTLDGSSTEEGLGKPDFVCKHSDVDIIMESVMAYRSLPEVQEHADRFRNDGPKSYQPTTDPKLRSLRGLVVIGSDVKHIIQRMEKVQLHKTNNDLEIMGLCPVSGYHSMVFIFRTEDSGCRQYTVPCNMVPQRLLDGELVVGHTFGKLLTSHQP